MLDWEVKEEKKKEKRKQRQSPLDHLISSSSVKA
jgi:hypothetical protein